MFEIIVILLFVALLARRMSRGAVIPEADPEVCTNGHKWGWVEQPGVEGREYLFCTRCKKTAQEILMD
jgi:hypothetical protein